MISYKYDWEKGPTRGTVGGSTGSGPWAAVATGPAGAGPARDDAALTRRRVVDYCRVTAAL